MRNILLFIALMVTTIASAQTGLNINRVFSDSYRGMKGTSETVLNNANLNKVKIDLYHSISFTGHPELGPAVERLVAKDGSRAVSKEVRYKSGHIYYGFYRLSPLNSLNRYILYLNGNLAGDNKIILLYLEGKASESQIKKLLK